VVEVHPFRRLAVTSTERHKVDRVHPAPRYCLNLLQNSTP
jgi:hypothetical protein